MERKLPRPRLVKQRQSGRVQSLHGVVRAGARMTTSSNALPHLRPLHVDPTLPLSRRTELRLQNMERFTRRLANTSIGFDEKSLAMETAVQSLGQLLVALIRERELSRSESP